MNFAEFFGVIKDVVVIGTGITGATVAVKGLKTWRKQLHGQADYNLAKDILIHLFKYRDAINNVRNPAMFSNEMPLPPEDKKEAMNASQIRHYGLAEAYTSRWEKVSVQRASIYTSMIEAQALWGEELTNLLGALFKHEQLLLIHTRYNLTLHNPDRDDRFKEHENKNFKPEILYDNLSETDDEFRNDFLSSLEPIETYLKSKLARDPADNELTVKIELYFKYLKEKLSCSRQS